jgi:hypothetical protein
VDSEYFEGIGRHVRRELCGSNNCNVLQRFINIPHSQLQAISGEQPYIAAGSTERPKAFAVVSHWYAIYQIM